GHVVGVGRVGPAQYDVVIVIGELAGIGADNGHAGSKMITSPKSGQRARIVYWIKTHHQQVFAGPHDGPGRAVKVDRIAQVPNVSWKVRIVEGHGRGGELVQFNKLVRHVVVEAVVGRMIHDLADHQWTDSRIRVGRPGALPELRDRRGVIHPEGPCAHGHKFL